MTTTLGIDIGGSGIKGALVNTEIGELSSERYRVETPQPASIDSILKTVEEVIYHFDWHGAIGCTFPGVIINQTIKTAANLNPSCVDQALGRLIKEKTGCPTWVLNDADAAAIAEMHFGVGKDFMASCLLITVGTGLGSAMFINGELIPNMELGHIKMNGLAAETVTSGAVREREQLDWNAWAKRFNEYLNYLHRLLWPERIIVGGGVSKHFDEFKDMLDLHEKIMPARLQNHAGIIGAAFAAIQNLNGMR